MSFLACLALRTILILDSLGDATCSSSFSYADLRGFAVLQTLQHSPRNPFTCPRSSKRRLCRSHLVRSFVTPLPVPALTLCLWRSIPSRICLQTQCSLFSFVLKISKILVPLLLAFIDINLRLTSESSGPIRSFQVLNIQFQSSHSCSGNFSILAITVPSRALQPLPCTSHFRLPLHLLYWRGRPLFVAWTGIILLLEGGSAFYWCLFMSLFLRKSPNPTSAFFGERRGRRFNKNSQSDSAETSSQKKGKTSTSITNKHHRPSPSESPQSQDPPHKSTPRKNRTVETELTHLLFYSRRYVSVLSHLLLSPLHLFSPFSSPLL